MDFCQCEARVDIGPVLRIIADKFLQTDEGFRISLSRQIKAADIAQVGNERGSRIVIGKFLAGGFKTLKVASLQR